MRPVISFLLFFFFLFLKSFLPFYFTRDVRPSSAPVVVNRETEQEEKKKIHQPDKIKDALLYV
jgi:hypothetical protein